MDIKIDKEYLLQQLSTILKEGIISMSVRGECEQLHLEVEGQCPQDTAQQEERQEAGQVGYHSIGPR